MKTRRVQREPGSILVQDEGQNQPRQVPQRNGDDQPEDVPPPPDQYDGDDHIAEGDGKIVRKHPQVLEVLFQGDDLNVVRGRDGKRQPEDHHQLDQARLVEEGRDRGGGQDHDQVEDEPPENANRPRGAVGRFVGILPVDQRLAKPQPRETVQARIKDHRHAEQADLFGVQQASNDDEPNEADETVQEFQGAHRHSAREKIPSEGSFGVEEAFAEKRQQSPHRDALPWKEDTRARRNRVFLRRRGKKQRSPTGGEAGSHSAARPPSSSGRKLERRRVGPGPGPPADVVRDWFLDRCRVACRASHGSEGFLRG